MSCRFHKVLPCLRLRLVRHTYRMAWITVVFALALEVSLGQAARSPVPAPAANTPVPSTAIAIENTNASFIPTVVDVPQADPARPTVTTPAHLPPTGFLQFEQGFVRAGRSPAGTNNQFSLIQVTKIALTTRLLVQFLTQPYTYNGVAGVGSGSIYSSDPGDLQVGGLAVAHKAVGALPTVTVGFIRRVRAGTSANLDYGSYSQSALFLFGGDLRGGFHYDSNVLFNEQNAGPVRHLQLTQTLAVTHPLLAAATHGKLNGIIEISHATQPFVAATSRGKAVGRADADDLLLVGTYTLRPNLIFDVSVDRGLTSTSTTWQGGPGVSYILPHRLWPDKHPVPICIGPLR